MLYTTFYEVSVTLSENGEYPQTLKRQVTSGRHRMTGFGKEIVFRLVAEGFVVFADV
jgi:hypothetical protein